MMGDIGALILAAGQSSRLGRPKQILGFRGKSLLRRMADAASDAKCSPVVVVLGSDAKLVREELNQTSAKIVENENWQRGIGTSIRAGVRYLIANAPSLDAILLLVCDQPFVDARLIKRAIKLREKTNKPIVASGYSDTLGVPALFDRSCFGELIALRDDSGAKPIILRDPERVAQFSFPEGAIDIDTTEDYEKLIAPS
jgi:molybdenum cofactor cytidylyltransferase